MRRNERFSSDFQQRIESLIQVLIQYILSKYKEMPLETQELNKSLAHFLKVRLRQSREKFYFFHVPDVRLL